MFFNNYIKFIHFLILKQDYENYFYNSILNNVTGNSNIEIYSSYPYNILPLDKFVLSSASKSCFILEMKLLNNNICSIESRCKTLDNRYLIANIDINMNNIENLTNCNGKISISKCITTKPVKILPQIIPQLPKHILTKIPPYLLPNTTTVSPELCYIKNECTINHLIVNYCDKHSFYQCQQTGDGDWILYKQNCPLKNAKERLNFDINLRICNY